MPLSLIAIQILVPVTLITWLVVKPARSSTGYFAQAAGTGLALLAFALVGIWVLPPWWMPHVYGLLWLLAVAARFSRHGFAYATSWPTHRAGWAGLALMSLVGATGASLSWEALLGRRLPDAAVVDLPLPMGEGIYLVTHGGSRQLINGHMLTQDPAARRRESGHRVQAPDHRRRLIERSRAYRGQSYAIDLVKIDRFGLRAPGLRPVDPAGYAIFGEGVFAPCDGTVSSARNDLPDMPVPIMDREHLPGNHVLLRCGDFVLLFAHFRQGSVRFRTGERVTAGEQLGEVGNSGKSSEPHLHFHAERFESTRAPLSGVPLALTIDGRFPVRNDRVRPGIGRTAVRQIPYAKPPAQNETRKEQEPGFLADSCQFSGGFANISSLSVR